MQSSSSPFTEGLFDDITLGGSKALVATGIDLIKSMGSEIGLIIKVSKCEVISTSTVQLYQQFDHFVPFLPQDACLLRAPLGNGRALHQALEARCNTLRSAISRMKTLLSHDALVLHRSSFSARALCTYLDMLHAMDTVTSKLRRFITR